MEAYLFEFIGTAVLLLFGQGVVANASLVKTYGNGGGWIVISFGWGMAVFAGVFISAAKSGAHLNPAVTLGFAALGKFDWALVPGYMLSQLAGAFAGSSIAWLAYKKHYDEETNAATIKGSFCTGPAIRSLGWNLLTEIIGTFALVVGVLYMATPSASLGALDALPVAFLVLGIGLSLGGSTGYAINPARDLGPRLAHAFLPIPNKGGNDWDYAWVPVLGPALGGLLAAGVFVLLA